MVRILCEMKHLLLTEPKLCPEVINANQDWEFRKIIGREDIDVCCTLWWSGARCWSLSTHIRYVGGGGV